MEELGRGIVLEPLAAGALVAAGAARRGARRRRAGAPGCRRSPTPRRCVVLAHQERAARYRLDACRDARPTQRRRRLDGRPARRASCRPATRPTPSSCRRASAAPTTTRRHRAVPRRARRAASTVRGYATQDGAPRRRSRRSTAAPATLDRAEDGVRRARARRRHRHRRALRRSGRRDGQAGRDHGRVHEHAQAVRRDDRDLPGAAPPHRRHEDAARAGALDELLRDA